MATNKGYERHTNGNTDTIDGRKKDHWRSRGSECGLVTEFLDGDVAALGEDLAHSLEAPDS